MTVAMATDLLIHPVLNCKSGSMERSCVLNPGADMTDGARRERTTNDTRDGRPAGAVYI